MSARDARRWTNWAGDRRCAPARVPPASVDELAAAIVAAGAEGLRVRAHGAGYSFTPIALSDGLLVDCARFDTVQVDTGAGLVRRAPVSLAALNQALDAAGMALANLGDIDRQTVAGAVSTATHGTGAPCRRVRAGRRGRAGARRRIGPDRRAG